MKRNVIFIIIDTLRAQNMGLHGYRLDTTPRIGRLARQGAVFEQAFSCINTTDPSLTSIFSGLLPRHHGILNHGPKVTEQEERGVEGVAFLPEILKSRGYTTIAVDWLARWHKRGYDQYIDINKEGNESSMMIRLRPLYYKLPGPLQKIARKLADFRERSGATEEYKPSHEAELVSSTAIQLLKGRREGMFLFLHYWDVHSPYVPPKKFIFPSEEYRDMRSITAIAAGLEPSITSSTLTKVSQLMKAERVSDFIARYDGEIKYVDYHVGRVIEFALTELENPLIVLTADHGESLGEHRIYFEHHGLYDVNTQVPLIIWSGGLSGRVKGMVQHIDILPTILDILGLPSRPGDGQSLVPLIRGSGKGRERLLIEEAHTQRKMALRTRSYKYITSLSEKCRYCNVPHGEKEELYDLAADPGETRNIIAEKGEIAASLRKKLEQNI